MQAVSAEADEMLEAAKALIEKVTSDPPPALKGAGVYRIVIPKSNPAPSPVAIPRPKPRSKP